MEGLRLGSVHISLIGLTLMPYLDVIWGPYTTYVQTLEFLSSIRDIILDSFLEL